MPRLPKNKLTIAPVYERDAAGKPTKTIATYLLHGYLNGAKIRVRSQDKSELAARRLTLLRESGLLPATDAQAQWQQEVNHTIQRIEAEFKTLRGLLHYTPTP